MSTYNDASLIYYPSGYKAGKAYSLKPTDGSGDLDFTRASTATRVNESGLIEEVATGVPRIDYTGGGCGKLLLEPQRTNIVLNNNDFSAGTWALTNSASIISNNVISPDGTLNADTLVAGANGSQVQFATSGTSGVPYTVSLYIKRISGTGVVNLRAVENTNTPITITNEWTRVTSTVTSTSTTIRVGVSLNTSGDQVAIWGAQAELGSYPTSYIPTLGTAVTRTQDTANKTGISSLINSEEGVLYAEISALANDGTYRSISLSDGTNNNRINFTYSNADNRLNGFINSNGDNSTFNFTQNPITDFIKCAFKFKQNECALWVNGIEIGSTVSQNTFTVNTLTKLSFSSGLSSSAFYGNAQSLMVFPSALSDTDLEALTTL